MGAWGARLDARVGGWLEGVSRRSGIRGYPWPEVLNDFIGSLNLRDTADEIAENESPDLYNVTFDERGGVGSRLGYAKYNGTPFSGSALVVAGYAWDSAHNILTQCGTGIYLNSLTSPLQTFSTADPVSFADFAGSTYMLHPVDGVFALDDMTGAEIEFDRYRPEGDVPGGVAGQIVGVRRPC